MWIAAEERAQASAELVAIVPLALLAALALGQLVVAGWALVSRGRGRPSRRARRSRRRPGGGGGPALRAGRARARRGRAPTALRSRFAVRAPALIPGLPAIPVAASTRLDPGASEPLSRTAGTGLGRAPGGGPGAVARCPGCGAAPRHGATRFTWPTAPPRRARSRSRPAPRPSPPRGPRSPAGRATGSRRGRGRPGRGGGPPARAARRGSRRRSRSAPPPGRGPDDG